MKRIFYEYYTKEGELVKSIYSPDDLSRVYSIITEETLTYNKAIKKYPTYHKSLNIFNKKHTNTTCWTPGLHKMGYSMGIIKKDYCKCLNK